MSKLNEFKDSKEPVQKEGLSQVLKSIELGISQIVERSNRTTLTKLAGQTDLPKATFFALAKGKVTGKKLNEKSIFDLCKLLTLQMYESYIEKDIVKDLKTWLYDFDQKREKGRYLRLSEAIEKYLLESTTDYTSAIWAMLCQSNGVSINTIKKMSPLAKSEFAKLVNLKFNNIETGETEAWVRNENGRYYSNSKDFSFDKTQLFLRIINLITKQITPSNWGRDDSEYYNAARVFIEGLNKEGTKVLRQELIRSRKKIEEIMRNESFHGDIPHFYLMISESLLYKKESENQFEKLL